MLCILVRSVLRFWSSSINLLRALYIWRELRQTSSTTKQPIEMASYCLLPRVPLDLEPECSAKCRSSVHASLIINAITKGDQEEIISFMKKLCQNYSHVTDCYGRNALHVAASCGKWKVVRYLLQREHCDCNIRDRESGWTSLHRSLFYGQLTCAKILLEVK